MCVRSPFRQSVRYEEVGLPVTEGVHTHHPVQAGGDDLLAPEYHQSVVRLRSAGSYLWTFMVVRLGPSNPSLRFLPETQTNTVSRERVSRIILRGKQKKSKQTQNTNF